MSRWKKVFFVVFSSILFALAIPNELFNFGCPVLAILAFFVFYFVYINFSSYNEAALLTGLFTLLVHFESSYWLAFFKDFAIFTLGASTIGTGCIGWAVGLTLYSPFCLYKNHNKLRVASSPSYSAFIPFRVLWFCFVYVIYEWLKSCGWLGYPWGTVSSAMYQWKLFIQIADITGTYGVTFMAILISAVLVEWFISVVSGKWSVVSFGARRGSVDCFPSTLRLRSVQASLGTGYCSKANKTRNDKGLKLIRKKISRLPPCKSRCSLEMTPCGLFQISVVSALLLILTIGYGAVKYFSNDVPTKYLRTIMVQQNSDPWKEASDDESILLSEKLTREKLQEVKDEYIKNGGDENDDVVDLVVWSEGCLKYSFPGAKSHYTYFPSEEPLLPFIEKIGVPFILGGSYLEKVHPRRILNAALLFDKEGKFRGAYGKNHLVPCAEVLPFSDVPEVSEFLKKYIGISAGWTPGTQYVYFDVPGIVAKEHKKPATKVISLDLSLEEQKFEEKKPPYVRIAPPICFDDAFPDVCRPVSKNGAELFMNITDDSWSKTRSSEYQHFVISSYRAIELRTTLARSTNSGYSVVIDPKGNVLADMPLFEPHAMFYKIPIFKRQETIYLKLGNYLPYFSIFVVVAFEIMMFILVQGKAISVSAMPYVETPSERKKWRKKKK